MEKRTKIGVILTEMVSIVFVAIGIAINVKQSGIFPSLLSFSCFNGATSLIVSLIVILYFFFQKTKKPTPISIVLLKFVSLCGAITALLVSFSFSYPIYDLSNGSWKEFVLDGSFYLSLFLPMMSFLSFVFLQKERKYSIFLWGLLAITLPGLYALIILLARFAAVDFNALLSAATKSYIFPSFVAGNREIFYLPYASFAAIIIYLIGVLLALLIKKRSSKKEGYSATEDCLKPNEIEFAELCEKHQNQRETPTENENSTLENDGKNEIEESRPKNTNASKSKGYAGGPRVYHISKQSNSGLWQVKLASGKKPIKLFKTQAEAIGFAKQLSKTQSGSIRVHSKKGTIRKE